MRLSEWFCRSINTGLRAGHRPALPPRPVPALATALGLILAAVPASAFQFQELADPPLLPSVQGVAPRTSLMALPQGTPSMGATRLVNLNIQRTKSKIYNPATGRFDTVELRSYTGPTVDPEAPYVAPTLEAAPGETINVILHNQLSAEDPSCPDPVPNMNIPHCFNNTNLHSHGLWVTPDGNGDNVLLTIKPGSQFQYVYNIPPDHPAGTFWYHPHQHGSTALQVSSGMVGALIVRGQRPPTKTENGDLDLLLKDATERVLVLQQIQYFCLNSDGKINAAGTDSNGLPTNWKCDPEQTGTIDYYTTPGGDEVFGPKSWSNSGRYTSINGRILPKFISFAGRVERWRLIHAGVRDTITFELRALADNAPDLTSLKPEQLSNAETTAYVQQYCTGPVVPYALASADGLTMAQAQWHDQATLQPGYRNDALVVFPKPGVYCVINGSAPASGSVSQTATSRRLLGLVVAAPSKSKVDEIKTYLTDWLVAAAQRTMPADVTDEVQADLRDSLKFTRFVAHPTVTDSELTGSQELTFFIDTKVKPNLYEVDGQAYKADRIDRYLPLGGAEEWSLKSDFASHPYHIHVNPFQVVSILDPSGRDVSGNEPDNASGSLDPQYNGMKGVWKDTIWVKSLIPPKDTSNGLYTIKIRTRYERYIGSFVLHCHILDHEDQGMMQNIQIVLTNGRGAPYDAGHSH